MSVCGGCGCCSSFYRIFYGFLPDTIHHIPKNNLKSKYIHFCFYVFQLSLLQLVCAAVGFPFLKKFGRLKFLLLVVYVLICLLGIFGSLFCQIYLFLPHFVLDVTYLLVLAALIIFSYVFKMKLGYVAELIIIFLLTGLSLISVIYSFLITHYLWKVVNKYDDYEEKKSYNNREIIEMLINQDHYLINAADNEMNINSINIEGSTPEIVPLNIDSRNNNNIRVIPIESEEEKTAINERNNNIKRGICVVCNDNKSCYAILPCGHLCLCEECCRVYEEREEERCPLCRLNILSYTRIYET